MSGTRMVRSAFPFAGTIRIANTHETLCNGDHQCTESDETSLTVWIGDEPIVTIAKTLEDCIKGTAEKVDRIRHLASIATPIDQASELRKQVAEKSHPKMGLWNSKDQSDGCWAVAPNGSQFYVYGSGDLEPARVAVHSGLVPNTWPIPEKAKATLRELGVPMPEDAVEEVK